MVMFITEEEIRNVEEQVDWVKRQSNAVQWFGPVPEIIQLAEKLTKEVRRLQCRVKWLEENRNGKK
jgi:hypothetical protein